MEMTITRALNELKLLDKRITHQITGAKFIAAKKNSAKKVNGTHTVDEFKDEAKNRYQSIKDLINRRNEIKTAIVASNASTIIKIAGKEMTVATAIERKNSIGYEKHLLTVMERNYTEAVGKCNRENDAVAVQRDEMVKSMGGKDKVNPEFLEDISKKYEEENGWSLVDPLHLGEEIEKLRKEIEDFENEVDFVLSESNSITKIQVSD